MFDEDAEDTRARAEQGRKDADFRDLYESIKMDIRDQANAGANKTTYRVSRNYREFAGPAAERLREEDFAVTLEDEDSERPALNIAWNANS